MGEDPPQATTQGQGDRMSQGDLFEGSAARARRWDPWTSHAAARRVESTGAASSQRARVLAYVREHPGETAAEIAHGLGMERHVPSRRLPELRRMRMVTSGEARVCRVCGTNQMTWRETA